ncbi:MAG: argininosuccinate lyase [Deltaproteobacteria bacterium]|nr:argininosuccinate lyase [Deltaproteobacteria bacterium]
MWGGRFSDGPDEGLRRFGDSFSVDVRLFAWDVLGSMAHAIMLGETGILDGAEARALVHGLAGILDGGPAALPPSEDVHSAVEAALFQRLGPCAGRLHTGRSRNDQVATDLRLHLRARSLELSGRTLALAGVLLAVARRHRGDPMPGYTHLQRAQVITIGHHLAAYIEMLLRDASRHLEVHDQSMLCPLGSGALAGSSLPLDRRRVAALLGFDGVTANSLDAVSDRDAAAASLFASALSMVHLSRLAEEMILWTSAEFAVLELPDRFCTGSSLMPHKKNPDVPELVRGRTGLVLGRLTGLLTVLKGLPLAYNKDLQEDKEALFDGQDTLDGALEILAPLWASARFRRDRCRELATGGNLSATALAEALVETGVPFREAHHRVGAAVRAAGARGLTLETLPGGELCRLLDLPVLPSALQTPEGLAAGQVTEGGPGPMSLAAAFSDLAARRGSLARRIATRRSRLPDRNRLIQISISS